MYLVSVILYLDSTVLGSSRAPHCSRVKRKASGDVNYDEFQTIKSVCAFHEHAHAAHKFPAARPNASGTRNHDRFHYRYRAGSAAAGDPRGQGDRHREWHQYVIQCDDRCLRLIRTARIACGYLQRSHRGFGIQQEAGDQCGNERRPRILVGRADLGNRLDPGIYNCRRDRPHSAD